MNHRVTRLGSAALLLVAATTVVAAQTPASSAKDDRPESVRGWERAFRKALKPVRSGIVIDVPETRVPPTATLPGATLPALERLSWSLDREIAPYGEAYALLRPPLPTTLAGRGWSSTLLDLLETLDQDLLRRLGKEGTTMDELPRPLQRALFGAADGHDVITARMIEGKPIGVGVYGGASAIGRNSAGEVEDIAVAEASYDAPLAAIARASASGAGAKPAPEPLKVGTAGDLVFPEGEILTLDEIVSRVRTKWKTNIEYDARLAPSLVFVKGGFTREELVPIVLRLATPGTPNVAAWERTSRVPRIVGLATRLGAAGKIKGRTGAGEITDEDVAVHRSYSRAELAKASPSVGWRSRKGEDPNTEFRLVQHLGIVLFAPREGTTSSDTMNWVINP